MTTIPLPPRVLPAPWSLPGIARMLRLAARQTVTEVRTYFRRLDQVFFTFAFPVLLLAVFSSIFDEMTMPDGAGGTTTMSAADYYLPAMLASGILLSGMQNLGVDLAIARTDGTMKRLAGTPLPPASFLLGKIGGAFVTGALQAAILVIVGATVFGVTLPDEADKWVTFAWVLILGTATTALLGIALSRVPRSGATATAVIIPIVLVLQFMSGVFIQFQLLPDWMQTVAQAFPVAWLALGMRAALLPDSLQVAELGGTWNLDGVAIALLAWLVIGSIITMLTFRWIRRS